MIYGLYLPCHKSNILSTISEGYDNMPSYPTEFRRYRVYTDKMSQITAYAETPCPESQLFECEDNSLDETIKDLDKKFLDENWLEENIYPYI